MKYLFRDNCVGISIFRQAGAAPTITLVSVVDITDSTATANVSIADGDDVSKTGVEIDTDPTFSNPTSYEDNGAVNSIAIDNLTAETTYYVRAYVIWSGQTIYSSNSLNFTTESSSILPAELQACEYLETDGNSHILLSGVNTQNITEISCKCQTNSSNATIFGARLSTTSLQLYADNHNPANFAFRFFSSSAINSSIDISNILNFSYQNGIADFNAQNITNSNPISPISVKIALFGNNINGSVLHINDAKIYNFSCNSCNLYPCYIKAGQTYTDNKGNVCTAGTCGMYDIVNQIFYTNDGSGTFSKGADINI